jgi:hypothetical protein
MVNNCFECGAERSDFSRGLDLATTCRSCGNPRDVLPQAILRPGFVAKRCREAGEMVSVPMRKWMNQRAEPAAISPETARFGA